MINKKILENLYYKKGYSAKRVGKIIGKSTDGVYSFMKRNNLPRRTSLETNNIIYKNKKPSYFLKSKLTLKDEKLKLAGTMLYWAEGYKNLGKSVRGGMIDLANSDPNMIKLFLNFLRKICGIDETKLRVYLYCYSNQDVDYLKKYWSKVTEVSLNQFSKPYIRQDFLPEKKGKMKYGLVHIRYSDKKLFLQIKNWTEEYLNEAV